MNRTKSTPKKRASTARTRAVDWKTPFLKNLRETGNILKACRAAKVARTTFYEHRKADAVFEAQVSEALEEAGDVLEAEAWRRAVKGVRRPVFQGGRKVGEIQEYSDTLLIFLLKGTKPQKYRERAEVTGADGGPIVTMVREVIVELPRDGTDPLES